MTTDLLNQLLGQQGQLFGGQSVDALARQQSLANMAAQQNMNRLIDMAMQNNLQQLGGLAAQANAFGQSASMIGMQNAWPIYSDPITLRPSVSGEAWVFIRLLDGDALDVAMAKWGLDQLDKGTRADRKLAKEVRDYAAR